MEDIGMHPDYRSGVSEFEECHICHRQFPILGNCAGCGKATCPDCVSQVPGTCKKCARILCPFCKEEIAKNGGCDSCGFVWDTGWDKDWLEFQMQVYDGDLIDRDAQEVAERRAAAERGVL